MQMLQGVWKQHLRPHAVVGYGVKIFLPSPPNYVTRPPGSKCCLAFLGKMKGLSSLMSCGSFCQWSTPRADNVVFPETCFIEIAF